MRFGIYVIYCVIWLWLMFLLTCRPYTGFWSYFYLEVMVWGVRRAEPKSRSDALQSIYPPCTAKQESCVWKWMMNLVNAYRPVFSWPSTLNPKPGPSSYNIDFIQKQKISLCSCNPCKIQGIISLIRFFFFFKKISRLSSVSCHDTRLLICSIYLDAYLSPSFLRL
jgi:hypothetical protein